MAEIWSLSIGALARGSDTKVPTIRYYEESGLMPAPPRTQGGQRRYTEAHLERLKFIRHARDLGFTIEDILELLRLSAHPDSPCDAVDALTAKHLREVESKIKRLQSLKRELTRMIGACANGALKDCRIIGTLADHARCQEDH